jgi:hypothetical protein
MPASQQKFQLSKDTYEEQFVYLEDEKILADWIVYLNLLGISSVSREKNVYIFYYHGVEKTGPTSGVAPTTSSVARTLSVRAYLLEKQEQPTELDGVSLKKEILGRSVVKLDFASNTMQAKSYFSFLKTHEYNTGSSESIHNFLRGLVIDIRPTLSAVATPEKSKATTPKRKLSFSFGSLFGTTPPLGGTTPPLGDSPNASFGSANAGAALNGSFRKLTF